MDNFEKLIAYIGGFTEIFLFGFMSLTTVFNQQTIVSKYLKRLYLTAKRPKNKPKGVETDLFTTFKFKLSDKASFLKGYFILMMSFLQPSEAGEDDDEKIGELENKYLTSGNRLFTYAYEKFGAELNAVTLF